MTPLFESIFNRHQQATFMRVCNAKLSCQSKLQPIRLLRVDNSLSMTDKVETNCLSCQIKPEVLRFIGACVHAHDCADGSAEKQNPKNGTARNRKSRKAKANKPSQQNPL